MCPGQDHSTWTWMEDPGSNPQMGCVPWPGMKPSTSLLQDDSPTNYAIQTRFSVVLLNLFILFFSMVILLILEGDRKKAGEGRERERETWICCSNYLRIHLLLLVCALPRDRTCNLGVLGQCSNNLSHLARAQWLFSSVNWSSIFVLFGLNYLNVYFS